MPRSRSGGSWVLDPVEVFTGEDRIYLYKRPTSDKFQLYIKTDSEGVIRQSTKTSDLNLALELARNRWYEIQARQQSGKRVKKEKKLFEFIEEYLEQESKRISDIPKKGITAESFRVKKNQLRWLREFFGHRNPKLDNINRQSLYNYGTWRQKESSAPPKTNHTINAEISTIKGFFTYLYTNEWIDQVPPIKTLKNESPEEIRRDYLTLSEWKRTIPTLVAWKKEKGITPRQTYNRNVIYCAIMVMVNSGLRIGELRKLKWSDIERNPQLNEVDGLVHHLISVRAMTTKTGKPRKVNSSTVKWFNDLRVLSSIKKDGRHFPFIPVPNRDDYVFCKEGKGNLPLGQGTWDRLWKEIKERVVEAGGTWIEEKNISWYSFRHSYISFAVQRGVNHLKLSRNCGTGLKYIENFYYHHEAEMSTEELNVGRSFYTKSTELVEPLLD